MYVIVRMNNHNHNQTLWQNQLYFNRRGAQNEADRLNEDNLNFHNSSHYFEVFELSSTEA